MAHLKRLVFLYLRGKQFAVKSFLQGPQKDKKVDPCKPAPKNKVGLGLVKNLSGRSKDFF